jgi:hypothetical protein
MQGGPVNESAARLGFVLATGALLLAGSCTNQPFDLTEAGQFVFLTQRVTPPVVMEALFEGRVIADAQGCIRLDSVDDATVVWPAGFRLVRDGTRLEIRAADDRTVGRLGGEFRLGGGEVAELHAGLGLSAADKELATSRCPGRFWIVGDVLS